MSRKVIMALQLWSCMTDFKESNPMPVQQRLAHAIRALAMYAVEKANSGHPGMPMGMADIAEVLWREFLQHNPTDPAWLNRDRFVLSNGHGSMLQYALLHLSGYDLTIEDIQQFRQLHSKTPGHPEYGETPGVEVTTGPLGQGLASAVGMAIAESILAQQFNRADFPIIDHHTYVFAGDGCLMEGISHEACSLAGTLGLGKLITFWDDNGISIDGDVSGWFTDNTPQRFAAYGWHVIAAVDGHDREAIKQAIIAAREETNRPSLICCQTRIGHGSPNLAGTEKVHGNPLGAEEIALVHKELDWSHEPFVIPEDILQAWDAREQGAQKQQQWQQLWQGYQQKHADLAEQLQRRLQKILPQEWQQQAEKFVQQMQKESKNMATRKASQLCLQDYASLLPELIGGSADLTGSNCTAYAGIKKLSATTRDANYIHYGVREFAMSAIMNGLAVHGEFIPYGGTFLTFSDYARNAIRLSAMMKQRVIYIYSHDSIGLGEDGPTHQPIEHASSLRLIPGLRVWRPCDSTETALAWQQAILHQQGPSCLLLTRQGVPCQPRDANILKNIAKGGYVLFAAKPKPDAIIIATGSEVALAMQAAVALKKEDIAVRVVSMPCCEVFKAQDEKYKEQVLPSSVRVRLAIEAGSPDYWYQFVGDQGDVLGIECFGASAPYQQIYAELGFTEENVVRLVKNLIVMNKKKVNN